VEHLPTGGLERVVVDLVREQVRVGHDCQVICLHDPGRLASELIEAAVPVHACYKRPGVDLRALWRLRRHLGRHHTEVMHTHNNTAHYIAMTAAAGLGIRCRINTRHGMGSTNPDSPRERHFARTMRYTSAVVAVCEAAGKAFVDRGVVPAEKLRVVPNGIHVERFHSFSEERRRHVQAELRLAATTQLVGSVGRLNRVKDQHSMVEAFVRLRSEGFDAALLLLGDGSKRAELQAQIAAHGLSDRVFLLGDRDDVAEWLPAFDVFALSSISEGYSIALLEACASALPIVATRVGGTPEIVGDDVNGLLVAASDPAAFAAALRRMLADPERAHAMGRAGRAWVEAHGSIASMAQGYEKVYAECQ
jgi:sugar transferase (PEP-CTERM/EpsH1 system associated)